MINDFEKKLKQLGINYSNKELDLLEMYYIFLVEYNTHTNLTTITEKEDVYNKHFYDSLMISKVIDLTKIDTVLDIGSGAGFPGVVLKIFYPNIRLTLLDSNNKKTRFLTELVAKLDLKDVNIINDRAENYMKNNLNSYDLCVSRAVAYVDIISSLSTPFIKLDGKVLLMKGDFTTEEIVLKKYAKELNIKQYNEYAYQLNNQNRKIIIISKEKLDNQVPNYASLVKKSEKRKKLT